MASHIDHERGFNPFVTSTQYDTDSGDSTDTEAINILSTAKVFWPHILENQLKKDEVLDGIVLLSDTMKIVKLSKFLFNLFNSKHYVG